MSSNKHLDQATSCTIGSTTFTEIQYHSPQFVGSGPSGALVTERYVANTALPVGVTAHHIKYVDEICVDADYASIFSLTSVTAPGTVLAACTVTERSSDGKTRTVTLNQAYIQSINPIKIIPRSR